MQLRIDEGDLRKMLRRAARHGATVALKRFAEQQQAGPVYFTEEEAAKQLAVSASALKKWRNLGLVRATVAARPVRYTKADIHSAARWMASRRDWEGAE